MKLVRFLILAWATFLSLTGFGRTSVADKMPVLGNNDLVSRINNARELLKERASNESLEDFSEDFLYKDEAIEWGNWANWGNWNNWNNWAKWSKWDDWYNWGKRWGNW